MKKNFIIFVATYVVSKIFLSILGFEYNLFEEGLIFKKLLIDFSTWSILYFLFKLVTEKFPK